MREVNYDERWKVARDLACKINLWPTVENLRHLDAALRRAKAEVWREAATHVLTCMHAVDAANDFDARAAQIEEGE